MQAKKAHAPTLTPEERIAQHRRQLLTQVWLPLALGLLIVLFLASLAILGTVFRSSEVNRWGSISAVFLLIPVLLADLVIAAIIIACTIGIRMLMSKLPGWLYTAQAFFARIAAAVHNLTDRIVAPVIRVSSAGAGAKHLRIKLTR
jgi:uncharacterized membrane protein SpoIIM required for sporulation